jgi:hypothetical protein
MQATRSGLSAVTAADTLNSTEKKESELVTAP